VLAYVSGTLHVYLGEVGDGRIEHVVDLHGVDRAMAAHRASESLTRAYIPAAPA
jgi:hypothetical protein